MLQSPWSLTRSPNVQHSHSSRSQPGYPGCTKPLLRDTWTATSPRSPHSRIHPLGPSQVSQHQPDAAVLTAGCRAAQLALVLRHCSQALSDASAIGSSSLALPGRPLRLSSGGAGPLPGSQRQAAWSLPASAAASPPASADGNDGRPAEAKLQRDKSSLTLSTDKDGTDEEEPQDAPDVSSDAFSEVSGVQTAASVWLPSSQAAHHSNKASLLLHELAPQHVAGSCW